MRGAPLGVATAERIASHPELPTIAESGFPGYDAFPSPYAPAHGPDTAQLPQGFLLLGPPADAAAPFPDYDAFLSPNNALVPLPTPVLRTPSLQYDRAFTVWQRDDPPDERTQGVTLVLRRLD